MRGPLPKHATCFTIADGSAGHPFQIFCPAQTDASRVSLTRPPRRGALTPVHPLGRLGLMCYWMDMRTCQFLSAGSRLAGSYATYAASFACRAHVLNVILVRLCVPVFAHLYARLACTFPQQVHVANTHTCWQSNCLFFTSRVF